MDYPQRLMEAVENGASADDIRSILEAAPAGEEIRGQRLFYIIDDVIFHDSQMFYEVAPDVMKVLIQHDTSCAHLRSFSGSYLLHNYCHERAHLEVIQLLLELNLRAVREIDDEGFFPLHSACCGKASLAVVELLFSRFPEAISSVDRAGLLPLHHACMDEPREDVVRFLLQHYPQGVSKPDSFGDLPIHFCSRQGSRTVTGLLIEAFPDGLVVRGSIKQSSPLHIACVGRNWETAQLLLARNPSAALIQDTEGCLPIHNACVWWGVPIELVQSLIDAHPDCLRVHARSDRLPLHCACYGSVSFEVFQLLLESYPAAIHAADEHGRLPLHVACRFSLSLDMIRPLVSLDPRTLLVQTHDGKTPLELFFHSSPHRSDETMTFLMKEQNRIVRADRDAVEFVAGVQLDFPDLVVNLIWRLAQPDVWYPPENGN